MKRSFKIGDQVNVFVSGWRQELIGEVVEVKNEWIQVKSFTEEGSLIFVWEHSSMLFHLVDEEADRLNNKRWDELECENEKVDH